MGVDIDSLKKIAELARLKFSEEELSKMSEDMEQIVAWLDQLDEVETEGLKAVVHMHDRTNVYRADEANNELTNTEALSNSPSPKDSFFSVPLVKKN